MSSALFVILWYWRPCGDLSWDLSSLSTCHILVLNRCTARCSICTADGVQKFCSVTHIVTLDWCWQLFSQSWWQMWGFEALTTALLKIEVFRDVMLCCGARFPPTQCHMLEDVTSCNKYFVEERRIWYLFNASVSKVVFPVLSMKAWGWSGRPLSPRILDLGARWKWMVNFTFRPLDPWVSALSTDWIGCWEVPLQSCAGHFVKMRYVVLVEIEPRYLSHQLHHKGVYCLS